MDDSPAIDPESDIPSAQLESQIALTPEMAEELAEEIATALQEQKHVNVVVAGRTGAGKSTLIGSLLPNQVTEVTEKGGAVSSDHTLVRYEGIIGDSTVSVYDARDFCSAKTSKQDARRLSEELRKEFSASTGRTINLLIFCQEMFGRFDESSLTCLTLFGGMLKRSRWDICVVALTKANLLPPTIEEAEDPAEEMIKVKEEMRTEMLEKYFKPHGLLKQFDKIPFVPVGYKTEKKNMSKLPCSEDSIAHLTKECILRCSPGSALVLASEFPRKKIALAAGIAGSSLVAGGTGATIGAVVGGLLTFYVGGAGGIPGAAIGGAVGTALGGVGAPAAIGVKSAIENLTQKVIQFYEKRKEKRSENCTQTHAGTSKIK